jgi:hypothetical protein
VPQTKHVHIMAVLAICWAIWKSRNRMCFENILIKSPNEIICHASALMILWTGLSKRELQPAGLDSRRCKPAGQGSER